jgi:ribosome maturation factor RimP
MNWQTSVERTVTALGYEVVDCERSSHGLLRVFIDRVPGRSYPGDSPAGPGPAGAEPAEQPPAGAEPAGGAALTGAAAQDGVTLARNDAVTLDDCERVTRQLQYALEVEGCDYARLEVSSPGLDRPLRKPGDFERFADSPVDLTLKQPFQGRKKYRGTLRRAAGPQAEGFELVFQDGKEDKVLGFALDEVREARLVPVVDFKGRQAGSAGQAERAGPAPRARRPAQGPGEGAGKRGMSGGHEQ